MPFFGVPLRNGVPIGLGSVAGFGTTPFNPSQLFSAGEQGVWYDPTDFSTLFQDSAGSTPVTAVEQSVGLILDKSGRSNNGIQTTSGNRPVLSARYNLLVGTDTLATQSVTTVASGYTLSFSGAGTVTLSGTATGTYSAGTNAITATAGTLTLTVSGSVTNADLRFSNDGVGLPAYQRVTSSTDYDTTGFPQYLRFDGTNSFLSVASFALPLIQRMTMAAFAENAAVANQGLISVTPNINNDFDSPNGYAFCVGNHTSSKFTAIGSTSFTYALNWTTTPTSRVPLSIMTEDKTTGAGYLRANGTQVASDTSFTQFNAVSNNGLLIGARFLSSAISSTLRLNGRVYGVIILGRQATASEIISTETWLNEKVKAY